MTTTDTTALPPPSLEHAVNRLTVFHKAMGHPAPERLTSGTPAQRLFRCRLIIEELVEFMCGLGVKDPAMLIDDILDHMEKRHSTEIDPEKHFTDEVDMVSTAHELSDVMVVCIGAAVSMGIPISSCFDAVMDSNMTKLGPDGKPHFREDGKILKGPNYKKPQIAPLLFPN